MSESMIHFPLWTPGLGTILHEDQSDDAVSLTSNGAQDAGNTTVASLEVLFERCAVLLGLVLDQALFVLNDTLQRINFSFKVSEFFDL